MSSQSIYDSHITEKVISHFKPTFLYIKHHPLTGKMYFGKTAKYNPEKYHGSGIHWTRHIAKHNIKLVETVWFCLFTDVYSLVETALKLSETMDIVNSSEFLNLIPETGLSGGSVKGYSGFSGKKHTKEHIEKLRELGRKRPVTDKMRLTFKNQKRNGSNNTNAKIIHIFDSNNNIMFVCHGNFAKVCEENNLPLCPLSGSYRNDGKPIFNKLKPNGRLKDKNMLKYAGWFAKIIST